MRLTEVCGAILGRGSARAAPVSSFDFLIIVLIGAIVSGIMMRIR